MTLPSDDARQNTDRDLWCLTDGDDVIARLFVTEGGSIGIDIGGHVIVKPIHAWHALGWSAAALHLEKGDRNGECTQEKTNAC